MIDNKTPQKMGAGVDLKITAFDKNGVMVQEVCKEGDIYLKNWVLFLSSMFKEGINNLYPDTYKIITPDYNTATIGGLFGSDPAAVTGSTGQYNWQNSGKIQLGTSTEAATISDYCLMGLVKEIQPGAPSLINDGNILKIIIGGTASFETETTLAECGIKIRSPYDANSSTYMLLTRDTFDAVTVPTGGSLTIQFELWFNGMPTEA